MPGRPETFKTNLNLAREAKAAKEKNERAKAMKSASKATHPRGPPPPRIGGTPAPAGTKRRNARRTRKHRTRRNRH